MHAADKVDYILKHFEQPDLEIAHELDETRYFVWLVKEVRRNERLQPRKRRQRNAPKEIEQDPDKLTTKDAAILMDKSTHYVRKKLVSGQLDGYKEHTVWIIEREDLEEFQQENI